MTNTLKNVIGIFEIVISLLFLSFYSKSMYEIITCHELMNDCGGWGAYNNVTYWPVGLTLLLVSVILLKTKSWYCQLLVIPVLVWILLREYINY